MTAVFKVDGVELPESAILMAGGIPGLPSAAWYCEPGVGEINIDDPDGAYEFAGWHTFTVDETACTGRERVWSGWLVGRKVSRGPYKVGAGRVWAVEITDINTLFSFEVFRASSAQRPAETDVARMAWMIASDPMAGTPVHDDGRFSTAGPANLPAAEFVRTYPAEMASNAAGQSNKNVYAYWDHAADEIGFHYDLQDNGPACSLTVSNVIADVDGATCFFPFLDADLDADAYGTFTGALVDYVSGSVYGRNDDLIDELSPTEFSPVNFLRDEMIRSDRIGTATTATAYLDAYLEESAKEREDITLMVRLPAALVNYIEAGMRIDVKLVHLPGLEDFTTLPIVRLSKLPSPGRTDTWDVRIELSANLKPSVSLGPAPAGPAGTPPPAIYDLPGATTLESHRRTNTRRYSAVLDKLTDVGWVMSGPVVGGGGGAFDHGGRALTGDFDQAEISQTWKMIEWDPEDIQPTHFRLRGRAVAFEGVGSPAGASVCPMMWAIYLVGVGPSGRPSPDDPGSVLANGTLDAISGGDTLTTGNTDAYDVTVKIPNPNDGVLALRFFFGNGYTVFAHEASPGTGTQCTLPAIDDDYPASAHSWTNTTSFDAALGPAFESDGFYVDLLHAELEPGESGSHRQEEVGFGDGHTTLHTTSQAYVPGSLVVKVDGIWQPASETDPGTGAFVLAFPPESDEFVEVEYDVA